MINDNIIEQVTDFKCLGYRISEYKSVKGILDVKLVAVECNERNG